MKQQNNIATHESAQHRGDRSTNPAILRNQPKIKAYVSNRANRLHAKRCDKSALNQQPAIYERGSKEKYASPDMNH
jgi:hypothetical protein